MSSGAICQIHIKSDHSLLEFLLETELWSLQPDLYQIWWFFNWISIRKWALEPSARSTSNMNIVYLNSIRKWALGPYARSTSNTISLWLNFNYNMSSGAMSQIYIKHDYSSMACQLECGLWGHMPDLDPYQIWSFSGSAWASCWALLKQTENWKDSTLQFPRPPCSCPNLYALPLTPCVLLGSR